MQQPCQYCGYESPASARFCRQCGAPLFAETEVSAAATRNYGRQESASSAAAVASGPLPPSVADVIAGETERYYQPPLAPPPAPLAPNTAPIKSKIKSKLLSWRWVMLFLVLFIGMAIGAMVRSGSQRRERPALPPEEQARMQSQREAQRRQADQRRDIQNRIREAQDRAREAQDRAREALDRVREAAEQASRAGAVLATTTDKPLDLSPYEYPGATMANAIRIPGHEMLIVRTTDGFEAVSQFYQKKLGKPVIQINEAWEKRLLFLSSAAPSISVSIETDYEHSGQLKIVVLRAPFRFFMPDEPQVVK